MGKRDYSLDFLKCFSMILVIVIHLSNYYCRHTDQILTSNFIVSMIYDGLARVCVPLFFMISGVVTLSGKNDSKRYFRRILKFTLILAFWTVIYYLWDAFYMHYEYNLISDFFNVFFEPMKIHLWFMYPIIGLYIVAPFIQKMLVNLDRKLENLFIGLWIAFGSGVYLFRTIVAMAGIKTEVGYPLAIFQDTYWLGYFAVGFILYKRLQNIKGERKYNKYLISIFSISMFITLVGTLIGSLLKSEFYQGFLAYRGILIIFSSICMFSYIILNSDRILKAPVIKIVELIVTYSFGVYLSHLLFYNILVKEFDILKLNGAYGVPLFTVLLFAVSFSFTYILKKIPFFRNVV